MPQGGTWKHDYLRSARAGIIGGAVITLVYCVIAVLSTPRPTNSEITQFGGVVIGLSVVCALVAATAVLLTEEVSRLPAALLGGAAAGAVVAFVAELVVSGWPQGEESHGVLVMTIAATLFGALVGAICWVAARR